MTDKGNHKCCKEFSYALKNGTDSEGWMALMGFCRKGVCEYTDEHTDFEGRESGYFFISNVDKLIVACPWCGTKIEE